MNPGEDNESDAPENGNVTVNVIELLGGILPDEDGQELDDAEILQHVAEAKEAEIEAEMIRAGAEAEGNRVPGEDGMPLGAEGAEGAAPPNTTVLVKPAQDEEDTLADLEGRETQVFRVGEGDTPAQDPAARRRRYLDGPRHDRIRRATSSPRRASPPARKCASRSFPRSPAATRRSRRASASSPTATTISSPSTRNAAGEFVASKSPAIGEEIANAALDDNDKASTSSVYASVYYAGLLQKRAGRIRS